MTIYTPYWWEEAPRPDPPQTALADDCDVAIIGAGYTGLAAAIELARAGRSVQVFDKSRAGEAASSRSGGIGSGNLRLSFAKMLARLGRQKAEAYYREGIEARADLSRFIEAEGIQCHFDPVGRFIGAVRPAHYESLAREAELLNKHFDLAAFSVPKSEQHKEIGSDAYHGGMVRPDIAGLQPALLHQGILDCALGGGRDGACQNGRQWHSAGSIGLRGDDGPGPDQGPRRFRCRQRLYRCRHALAAPPAGAGAQPDDRHRSPRSRGDG